MNLRYLGHSAFLITSSRGTAVVIDPYGTLIPYEFPAIAADVVVMSHEHADHSASWRLPGSPQLIKRTSEFPTEHEVNVARTGELLTITGTPTFHDDAQGRKRGPNTVYQWEMDGLRICHMGDLGHLLTENQAAAIGPVDALMLPVGGKITIGAQDAALVVNQLKPRWVFPMHYLTDAIASLSLASDPLDAFLGRMERVEHASSTAMELRKDRVPARTTIIVLEH